jgi:uncharacterized repeat protein (TIGR03803 family)
MAYEHSQRNGTMKIAAVVAIILLAILVAPLAQAQTFTVLHTFTGGADGAGPFAVTLDAAGNLYGDTTYGAEHTSYCLEYGCGTAYKLSQHGSNWILSTLHSFLGNVDGSRPGALTLASDGTLYGVSNGANPYVRVFRLQPPISPCHAIQCNWSYATIYSFNEDDNNGAVPGQGPLAFDRSGNIYGVTPLGGNNGCNNDNNSCGTVFELSQSGGTWNVDFIHLFSGTDGSNPGTSEGLILDRFGNLYGTTSLGGPTRNYGMVFQLVPSGSGWNENVVYAFAHDNDDQGRNPQAGVTMDSSGNLYGTNTVGGAHDGGAAFELSYSSGWDVSKLYSFATGTGGSYAALTLGPDGNLYGTTSSGGQNGKGAVFQLTSDGGSWTYTSLHDFTGGADGSFPYGSVVFDAQGNLYGAAYSGGADNAGVVFQITP